MPVQTPQWCEFLSCPVCQNDFETKGRIPVSLTCGHTICRTCLQSLQRNQCPFDQNQIGLELTSLPANTALLQLIGNGEDIEEYRAVGGVSPEEEKFYSTSIQCLEELALFLKPSQSSQLSRPMQRKLITLVTSQLMQEEGRSRGVRSARSLGERSVTELILQHQNPQQLSANLWAAVRARGCQFLGPAMQEEVLKLVLLALEEGSALSRKVLVMFVVQRLEPHFPQASKTSIGHVVQLLYRASCFKVTKRDGDSSLMQLKEEFRTYDNLRREHDTQIVQIATEGGLRIAPDQWSSLLYGDSAHKSHMQSIIDKLQTPQSFGQSVQELVIALQRTGDPGRLSCLRPHLDILTSIDPSTESEVPSWQLVVDSLKAAHAVVGGLVSFCNLTGAKKTGETYNGHLTRYKTSMCRDLAHHGSCPRGHMCTFAHTQIELEFHRNGVKTKIQRADTGGQGSFDQGAEEGQHEPQAERLQFPQNQFHHHPAEAPPSESAAAAHYAASMQQNGPAGRPRPAAGSSPSGGHQQAGQQNGGVYTRRQEPFSPPFKEPPEHQMLQPQLQQPPPRKPPAIHIPELNLMHKNAATMSVHHQLNPAHGMAGPLQPTTMLQQTAHYQQAGNVHPMHMAAAGYDFAHLQQAQQAQAGQLLMMPTMPCPTQVTPIVDSHGTPLIDMATGHPLMATHTPLLASPVQLQDGQLYPVQQNHVQIANIQMAHNSNIAQLNPIMIHQPNIIPSQDNPSRRFSHEISPELATRSLSALKDRKEEIISELGDIVGPTAAKAIGDITSQQAAGQKYGINIEVSSALCQSNPLEVGAVAMTPLETSLGGLYGIWTSKPIVTITNLIQTFRAESGQGTGAHRYAERDEDEIRPLPEGICVSRFGPISRRNGAPNTADSSINSEPRSVTARNMGAGTISTRSMLQPVPSASAVPDNIMLVTDQNMLFEYNPGYYSDYYIEGMDSVSMQHLVNPPVLPISPMPNQRDLGSNLNTQNMSMFVESNRIQKELQDLQRRISCLSVAENSAHMALKRDRLAFELRMVEGGIQERRKEIDENESYMESKHQPEYNW